MRMNKLLYGDLKLKVAAKVLPAPAEDDDGAADAAAIDLADGDE